jgi:hypothetical protein
MARESLQKAINRYGLEGAEDKIKHIYELAPKLRDYMLKEYYAMIKGEKL